MRDSETNPAKVRYPSNDDPAVWRSYWRQMEQPWRTEPEISPERQRYLMNLYKRSLSSPQSDPPFARIILHRGDIEWLQQTTVRMNFEIPTGRINPRLLDVHGADIRANLKGLDLKNVARRDADAARAVVNSRPEGPRADDEAAESSTSVPHQDTENSADTSLPMEPPRLSDQAKAQPADPQVVQNLKAAYETGERDFTGWYLAGADLQGVNLRNARLQDVDFRDANLWSKPT